MIDTIQEWVLIIAMIILSITILLLIYKAYLGPRFTDRVLSVNVINVKIIVLICILAVFLEESYVVDIAIVYALFSFLSVIVLARIYLNDYLKNQAIQDQIEGEEE